MKSWAHFRNSKISVLVAGIALIACIFATGKPQADDTAVTASNWGRVTAPVAGTHESAATYSSAELFAGPNKFGDYFSGVLPNGKIVKPAGISTQIGMNPLGAALTPDGKFLITSNDDERDGTLTSLQNPTNKGGYSLTVVDTATMKVISQINTTAKFFVGLVVTGSGPYTAWVSGGPDNDVKLFTIDQNGAISAGTPAKIVIAPILPSDKGYVSNYTPDAALNTADGSGNKPPVPSGFDRVNGAKITFPAGSALSSDGRFLYVACNGDNSIAVIDVGLRQVVRRAQAGYFPYGVSTSRFGDKVFVTNWGITEYKFAKPTYDATTGKLTAVATTGQNQPDGFYVAPTSTSGTNPQTSSISVLDAPGGNGGALSLIGSLYQGHQLDELFHVGDTHPSATAVIHQGSLDVLYVAKANSDSLGIVKLHNNESDKEAKIKKAAFDTVYDNDSSGLRQLADFDLSPISLILNDGHPVHGAYPNALVASPDNQRLYVAEAGLNSVAVLDVSSPFEPVLVGRIPTGWYPTALALSPDGKTLYVVNAKGIGEDVNPNTNTSSGSPAPTGLVSFPGVDSNFIFGTVQKVDLTSVNLDTTSVLANNYALHDPSDTSVVPIGGAPSPKIKHVFFILHENKTFDSMLGNLGGPFGAFASTTFNNKDGSAYTNGQYTGVSLNLQQLAKKFAAAGNYYSDSEESDAGHQFAASGTATDWTEKTLLVKSGRGLLVNKNFEPEDYPEGGYIFNNAARNGVSFKDYGALIRIEGTDTGTSTPTLLNDPSSGLAGFPQLQANNFDVTNPLVNLGDVASSTQGLGQSYFLKLPILSILGGHNPNGEARLDRNYPGYNFNISDQRRALEFIKDFDRMVTAGTLPQFVYIYQPNDHTGGVQAPNSATVGSGSALQEIADGDVGLGMVVNHIMKSPIYYNAQTGEGSAIFVTFDDAQSSIDHIHPHRTPLVVVSPYAKPGYLGLKHYVTASIVKTEELLLGLPPNNLGDLFATDLRDLFQPTYNGLTAADVPVTLSALTYKPSPEGKRIWALARHLDLSGPDRDSARLGVLTRMSIRADELHREALRTHQLTASSYRSTQARLYASAWNLVHTTKPRDIDD
jgi:DNA-binding beta-propeller fold protein YncE